MANKGERYFRGVFSDIQKKNIDDVSIFNLTDAEKQVASALLSERLGIPKGEFEEMFAKATAAYLNPTEYGRKIQTLIDKYESSPSAN